MQVSGVGTAQIPARVDGESAQSVLVARKALDQIKIEGQQMLELIKTSNPSGTGTRLSLLA